MKAARLFGPRDLRIVEVPEPTSPGPGEVLLRVGVVGICGSDLLFYQQAQIGDTLLETPVVPGHEFSATVITAGSHARDGFGNQLNPGQMVAVDPSVSCRNCDLCERGRYNLCRNLRFIGLWPNDGALQERIVFPARSCFPLPGQLSLDEGTLLEPLGVAIHAVDLAGLSLGETVAVLGCGPIGLLIVRLCKLSGVRSVFATDVLPWRVDAARDWGADVAIDAKSSHPVETIRDLTGGRGADVVFEAAWGGEAAEQAIEVADLGGRVIFVGIPRDDRLSFRHSAARRKGLSIRMCRRMLRAYPKAIALASNGQLDLKLLVSHRFTLDQASEAFALNAGYGDGALKVMIGVSETAQREAENG